MVSDLETSPLRGSPIELGDLPSIITMSTLWTSVRVKDIMSVQVETSDRPKPGAAEGCV